MTEAELKEIEERYPGAAYAGEKWVAVQEDIESMSRALRKTWARNQEFAAELREAEILAINKTIGEQPWP